MPPRRYYTAADVLAIPEDGNRYKVVHGELLETPAPRPVHQHVAFRLAVLIGNHLDRYPVGETFPGGDLSWSANSLGVPDLFAVDQTEAGATSSREVQTLLLVIEILSPSTAGHDRFTKRRLYREVGIPVYWLVDAGAKVVETWTPESVLPTMEHGVIRWHPKGPAEPPQISLGKLVRQKPGRTTGCRRQMLAAATGEAYLSLNHGDMQRQMPCGCHKGGYSRH